VKESHAERLSHLERRVTTLEERQAKLQAWHALFRTVMESKEFPPADKLRRLGLLLGMLDREFAE
jgi:hypothetical protein